MPKTDYQSVDEYLAAQPQDTRAVLELVRRAIRRALPKAEERISYQIAAFRTDAGNVIYFAGWKKHVSVYPVGARLAAGFDGELDPYMAQKDTLRFPLSEPVPAKLIEQVARARAAEEQAYAAAERAAKKVGEAQRRSGQTAAKRGKAKRGKAERGKAERGKAQRKPTTRRAKAVPVSAPRKKAKRPAKKNSAVRRAAQA